MRSLLRHRAAVAALVLVWVLGLPAPGEAAARPFRPFAPDSIWNLRLRDDARLHPGSARSVDWLEATVRGRGAWINSTTCTMPTYWAGAATPRVRVHLDHPSYMDPALMRAWASVPIPRHARPARCADRNLAVLARRPDGTIALWEFWAARKRSDGSWTAKWGGTTADVTADRGYASPFSWRDPAARLFQERASRTSWNVTASSASMIAGVITREDLRRGRIDHALAIAAPDTARGHWLWPAQRTDGGSTDPGALPEGAHLRLDPRLDVDRLAAAPLVWMMARAAQRYGIVVRDRTFDRTIFYTDRRAGQTDLAAPLLGGAWPSSALRAFPWGRLQMLDAPACTGWTACRTRSRVVIDTTGRAAVRAGRRMILDTTNSPLEQPRARVEWDLDGNGRFERSGRRRVRIAFTPHAAGRLRVGVRITMRDGAVVEGRRSLSVRP
jgi:hypothetical protein